MQEKGHYIHGILREHLDSDIGIERKIVPMNYHVVKHLKMVKKDKATGPDNIKGELYSVVSWFYSTKTHY